MKGFIYKDQDITITKDMLILPNGERESIQLNTISDIQVTRKQEGDYKSGAVLFFVIGVVTVVFGIGIIFLILGIAAWHTNIYSYRLLIVTRGEYVEVLAGRKRGQLKSLARTIHGAAFSKSQLVRV